MNSLINSTRPVDHIGAGNAVKQPLVNLCLNDMDNAIGSLSDVVNNLQTKLQPIMQPEPPSPKNPIEKDPSSIVPMAKRITDQKDMIVHLTSVLIGICNRLEI